MLTCKPTTLEMWSSAFCGYVSVVHIQIVHLVQNFNISAIKSCFIMCTNLLVPSVDVSLKRSDSRFRNNFVKFRKTFSADEMHMTYTRQFNDMWFAKWNVTLAMSQQLQNALIGFFYILVLIPTTKNHKGLGVWGIVVGWLFPHRILKKDDGN